MNNNKKISKDYENCTAVESYSNLELMNAVKKSREEGKIDGKKIVESLENVEVMWVMPDGEQIYTEGFKNYTFEYENK